MKAPTELYIVLLTLLSFSTAHSTEIYELMHRYNCHSCHLPDRKLIGPSFNDIGSRYWQDADAGKRLIKNTLNGTSGNWGPVPMPPTGAPQEAIAEIVGKIINVNPASLTSATNNSASANYASSQSSPTGSPARYSPAADSNRSSCHSNLRHLADRIPYFSDPNISQIRSMLIETDIRQTIGSAKQQGFSGPSAVQASLQQARENERVAREGAQCAADVDSWGSTDEAFYQAISSGRINKNIACNSSSIRASCLCAAIVNKIAAAGARAIAGEMQCYIRNGQW